MNYTSGFVTGVAGTLLLAGTITAGWWLGSPRPEAAKAEKPTPPATVPSPLKEDEVNGVKLTPEAVRRLALTVQPVEKKSMRRSRVFGGEVTVPVGRAIVVSAPLGGVLQSIGDHAVVAGRTVKKGEELYKLLPLLTPEGRANLATALVDADGQVATAKTTADAALIALNRAKRLLGSEAGSRRAVDEAQERHDVATRQFEAATARRQLLTRVIGEVKDGTAGPINIESPASGLLRTVSALPGQNVPSGAALFEVVDLSSVWLRVPIYAGEVPSLDATSARVGALCGVGPEREARPVDAPPSANPLTATVDLYFALDNRETKYSPGQRVGVRLGIHGEDQSLTLPWSAVVIDIHGGTWVYEQTAERSYTRRRVVVSHVIGPTAVLAAGPALGTRVVATGAAELFGAETGFTK